MDSPLNIQITREEEALEVEVTGNPVEAVDALVKVLVSFSLGAFEEVDPEMLQRALQKDLHQAFQNATVKAGDHVTGSSNMVSSPS